MTYTNISSKDNPLVKQLQKLEKGSGRRKWGRAVVEGAKEVAMALKNGYKVVQLIVHAQKELPEWVSRELDASVALYKMSPDLFNRFCFRKDNSICLAIIETQIRPLPATLPHSNALYLIIEGIEKPGNLGAILRTADACKATGVIVCDPVADIMNPNTIRSSVGTVFSVPVYSTSAEACVRWLEQHAIKVFTSFIETGARPYYKASFEGPCALVLGTEDRGLSAFWRRKEFENIYIPMLGENDSLNVSVAAAILAYEARKQKGFEL